MATSKKVSKNKATKHPKWMGKMRKLTRKEIKEFLAGPIVARLATVKRDGSPYVVPIWQHYDGKAIYFIPRERSIFVKHIQKDPRVCVSCAMDQAPVTRVIFQGRAEVLEGPSEMKGQMLRIARRMALRYLGKRGPEYIEPTRDRPRFLIKLVPEKITSWDGVEWAKKYL